MRSVVERKSHVGLIDAFEQALRQVRRIELPWRGKRPAIVSQVGRVPTVDRPIRGHDDDTPCAGVNRIDTDGTVASSGKAEGHVPLCLVVAPMGLLPVGSELGHVRLAYGLVAGDDTPLHDTVDRVGLGHDHGRGQQQRQYGDDNRSHRLSPSLPATLTGADDPMHAENAFTPFLGRREELRLETEKAWGEAILGHTRAGLLAVIFLSAVMGFSSALLIKRGPEFLRSIAIESPA